MNRPWSASRLKVAASGCPSALCWYDSREASPPDAARDRGSDFHRIVEAIERAVAAGMDGSEAARRALDEVAASVDLESLVSRWAEDGWCDLEEVVGFELALAVDEGWDLVDWKAPNAVLRGILDRVEIRTEEDGRRSLIVTDWKSGWAGWATLQAESYAVLGDAWCSQHAPDVEAIVCRIYSPIAGQRHEERWRRCDSALENARNALSAAIRSGRRLEASTASRERPSAGCGFCGRKSACETFQGLSSATGWAPIADADSARAAVDLLGALEARAKDLEADVRRYCTETGEMVPSATGGCYGRHVLPARRINGVRLYSILLDRISPMLTEGRTLEAARSLATFVPPSVTAADTAAKLLCPGDRDGADALRAEWTLEGERKEWGLRPVAFRVRPSAEVDAPMKRGPTKGAVTLPETQTLGPSELDELF